MLRQRANAQPGSDCPSDERTERNANPPIHPNLDEHADPNSNELAN